MYDRKSGLLTFGNCVRNGHEPAVALLDTGSTNTFITERLVSKLSLQGKSVPCRLSQYSRIKRKSDD